MDDSAPPFGLFFLPFRITFTPLQIGLFVKLCLVHLIGAGVQFPEKFRLEPDFRINTITTLAYAARWMTQTMLFNPFHNFVAMVVYIDEGAILGALSIQIDGKHPPRFNFSVFMDIHFNT